jgi:hypothetical protein
MEYIGAMNTLFEQAIEKACTLPEEEREAITQIILDEIADRQTWQRKFATTASLLDQLADEAIEADKYDQTTSLNFPRT